MRDNPKLLNRLAPRHGFHISTARRFEGQGNFTHDMRKSPHGAGAAAAAVDNVLSHRLIVERNVRCQ